MKQIKILYILILTTLLSCHNNDTNNIIIGKKLYNHYADTPNLTVAFIGDYEGYTAVMLKTDDSATWHTICYDFGINSFDNNTNNTNNTPNNNKINIELKVDIDPNDIDNTVADIMKTVITTKLSNNKPLDTLETNNEIYLRKLLSTKPYGDLQVCANISQKTLWVYLYNE